METIKTEVEKEKISSELTEKQNKKINDEALTTEKNTRFSIPPSEWKELIKDPEESDIVLKNKEEKDWFIILRNNLGYQLILDLSNFKDELKEGLIDGSLNSENKIEGHYKNEKGEWSSENTTVKKFTKDIKELRMLYDPIWNHAMIGLKWGLFLVLDSKYSIQLYYLVLLILAMHFCF